jgi:sugar phosphate isomerase/epimerase
MRWRADHPERLGGPLDFLEHCRSLGAGGMQTAIGDWDEALQSALRRRLEETGMFLEGQIGLPQTDSETERFAARVRAGRAAGASVFRTVMLSGRRYETFRSAEHFRDFARRGWEALVRAEKVARAQNVRLALENHKDWRVEEMLSLQHRMSSEHVGVCVDTGNSIALLEDPMKVVEAYAPLAATCHFKDMGVAAAPDGFVLSEVPFGEGFLDLAAMVSTLRRAQPALRLNLEMITRDPLPVPCLSDPYWVTMPEVRARPLMETLRRVREHPPEKPLPRVTGLNWEQRLRLEEANNRACMTYTRERLNQV